MWECKGDNSSFNSIYLAGFLHFTFKPVKCIL